MTTSESDAREPSGDDAIRVTVTVDLSSREAFERYTSGIGDWWPVASHSVGGERTEAVVFEAGVGGRIYEVLNDGSREVWGTVLTWDPPSRVAHSWHPGRPPETGQEIDVTFEPSGQGTGLRIEQSGWHRLGEKADETREDYVRGWPIVLDAYRGA